MDYVLNGMRHMDIHDPATYRDKRVAVVGVGTIGSHLAHTLARMQVPMDLYDHDSIEPHNLATQTYGANDVGRSKVGVVLDQIRSFGSDVEHRGWVEKYNSQQPADIIVSAVDSLVARKAIAQQLMAAGYAGPIVDGRVGREQVEVYTFGNATAWFAQLPDEGDEDPCGARFTAYTANIAAGLMANNVKRLLMGQKPVGRVIYDAATSIFIRE